MELVNANHYPGIYRVNLKQTIYHRAYIISHSDEGFYWYEEDGVDENSSF